MYSNWQQTSGWSSTTDPTGQLGTRVLLAQAGNDTNNEDYLKQEIGTSTAWTEQHYSVRYQYAILNKEDVYTGAFGMIARATSITGTPSRAENCYIAKIDIKNSTISILRRVGGSDTELVSAILKGEGVTIGKAYTLRFDVFGIDTVSLQFYLDDTLMVTTSDSSTSKLATGFSGIYTYSSSVYVDQYYVYKYSVAGVSAGWTPATLTGTVMWLKSDAGITKDASDQITIWADQTAEANNAVNSTGSAEPVLSANQLNGYPVVDFVATKYLEIANDASLSMNATGLSIGVVINLHTFGAIGDRSILLNKGDVLSETYKYEINDLAVSKSMHYLGTYTGAGDSVASNADVIDTSAYYIVYFTTNKDSAITADTFGFFVNGTNVDSLAGGVGWGVDTDNVTRLLLGRDESGKYLDAAIAEIVLVAGQSSLLDRQKFEGYTAHRYALTANLPADHPYKNSAP